MSTAEQTTQFTQEQVELIAQQSIFEIDRNSMVLEKESQLPAEYNQDGYRLFLTGNCQILRDKLMNDPEQAKFLRNAE